MNFPSSYFQVYIPFLANFTPHLIKIFFPPREICRANSFFSGKPTRKSENLNYLAAKKFDDIFHVFKERGYSFSSGDSGKY